MKKFIHKKNLLLFFILYVNSILITTAQDKIYTLQGKTILCAILKETKTSVFYNVNNVPKLYSIDFSEIDYILILAHNFSDFIIESFKDSYKGKFITFLPTIQIS